MPGQMVNLLKFFVFFDRRTQAHLRHAISQRLGVVEHEGICHYLGIPISSWRLRRVEYTHLE